MPYRTILILLDAAASNEATQEVAFNLALVNSAQLVGLALAVEPAIPSFGMHPVLLDAIDMQRQASEAESRRFLDEFLKGAEMKGLSVEAAQVEGRMESCTLAACVDVICHHARYFDLVVMAKGVEGLSGPGSSDLAERVTLQAGRPVLFLPPGRQETFLGKRVALAWNASREAARSVSDAMPFLTSAESVRVISVDPQKHIAEQGPEPGLDVAHYLARHGCKVEVCNIAGPVGDEGKNAGDALISEVEACGADLLVMGAYGHSRLRELVLGGVTRTVFKRMTTPVLMAH